MRSSSVRTLTFVLAGFVMLVAPGCGPAEQPAPTKIEKAAPFDRGQKPPRDPNSPFRDPATQTPAGREGEQLSDEAIEELLAKAAEFAQVKDLVHERDALSKCANKIPANARCDGQLGLSLIPAKNRRATALYYLREAAQLDDPKADAAMYAAIAEQLSKFGQHADAIAAMDKAVARDPSAERLFAFGRLLSFVPERLAEAADRMAEAREKDDRIEWLYEEAVIRGQLPIREQAEKSLALFKTYVTRAETAPAETTLPSPPAQLASRIAELELLRKQYPTQAEYDKRQAKAAAEPEPAPAPTQPS